MADKPKEKPAVSNKCRVTCDYHAGRRAFRARDAGRICCYAMAEGDSWAMILKAVEEKCGPVTEEVEECACDCDALKKRIEAARAAFEIFVEIALIAIPSALAVKALMKAWKAKALTAKQIEAAEKEVEGLIELMKSQEKLAKQRAADMLQSLKADFGKKAKDITIIEP